MAIGNVNRVHLFSTKQIGASSESMELPRRKRDKNLVLIHEVVPEQ